MTLAENILSGENYAASAAINEKINILVSNKLKELKNKLASDIISEMRKQHKNNILKQGRMMIIRRRIRNGKMQRNVKRSTQKGFTIRGGKVTRISAAQRIKMKISQKRGARKRKVKMASSLRKRRISIKKRTALGLKEHYESRNHQQD